MTPTTEMLSQFDSATQVVVLHDPELGDVTDIGLTVGDLAQALALLPGEAGGWIWEDEFTCEREVYETWVEAGRKPTAFYFSPAASPAPLPVAVKALTDDVIERIAIEYHNFDGDDHEVKWSKSKSNYRGSVRKLVRRVLESATRAGAIRSALSSPVGGMEERPQTVPCPCTTFEQDEDCPIGMPSLLCSACEGKGEASIETVVALAAEMLKVAEQVDELEDPFAAWETIELLKSASSPTPSSDIAALREENERFKDALGKIDRLGGEFGVSATHWRDEVLTIAAAALQHVAKGERG